MDLADAREILYVLAGGRHPITRESLADDDACNNVDVVRALYTILAYVDSVEANIQSEPLNPRLTREQRNLERSLPRNKGKSWTIEEDEELCDMFDRGVKASELCAHFERTHAGIAARLVRLGKISERQELEI